MQETFLHGNIGKKQGVETNDPWQMSGSTGSCLSHWRHVKCFTVHVISQKRNKKLEFIESYSQIRRSNQIRKFTLKKENLTNSGIYIYIYKELTGRKFDEKQKPKAIPAQCYRKDRAKKIENKNLKGEIN